MQKIQLPRGYQDSKKLAYRLKNDDPVVWDRTGKSRALMLFKEMSKRVPAYKDFLKKNRIDPKKIKTFKDLSVVPAIDKDNYLRKYPKEMLCWDGIFGEGAWVISTTSGSTGEPFYFPRQTSQDKQYAVTAEQYLLSNFNIDKQKTLYIVGFPMGAWIGGVFTYEAIKLVADKGYDLSLITPGIHKEGIINSVKQLSKSYDQILIGAYAPFLRDILEDGEAAGINWQSLNVKFIFSAEAFSEDFRDYVRYEAGLEDIHKDTLNHYGTVDMGTMAHETPLSILIRRTVFDSDKQKLLFPEKFKQPTLCQYDPGLFFFEEVKNTLFCSAFSGIPLFRYDLKDYGGIIKYNKMKRVLAKNGVDIDKKMKKLGLSDSHWKLPFVYVYERNDFSVSYFAFNVYPEPIRKSLQKKKFHSELTGKFTMYIDYTVKGVQHLNIVVERTAKSSKKGPDLKRQIVKSIHERLLKESTEYPEIFKMMGAIVKPVIYLRPYEDLEYFKPGTKQKWIKK